MATRIGGGVLLVLVVSLLLIDFTNPPDFVLFLGRFHPMVVHFPIGLLCLAALLEGLSWYYPQKVSLEQATIVTLGLGAVMSVVSVGVGYFLSLDGGYNEGVVSWHMWLGIGVALAAVGAALLKLLSYQAARSNFETSYLIMLGASVVLLIATGHMGSTLTHGPGYLTYYMPSPLKTLLGAEGGPTNRTIANVDSAVVFTDLVQPILNDRCVSCHSGSKTKGDLRLDTPEEVMKGGEDGKIITAGQPAESELIRRITLPLYHDDRMPPNGQEPLTIEQTELIRWWIQTGASFDTKVAEVRAGEQEPPTSVQTVLARLSRPKGEIKTGIYALDVPLPDSSDIERLEQEGFNIQLIAQDVPFLEVQLNGTEPVSAEQLEKLEPLFSQIAWVDLRGKTLEEEALAVIGEMQHLTHLHLQQAALPDEGLQHLQNLEYLEYLNLYGTNVSDAGLTHLTSVANLKKVFLWQSDVTEPAVQQFKQNNKGITVNYGTSLVLADSSQVPADSVST